MRSRRLLWQIFPTYLLITLVTLVVWSVFVLHGEGQIQQRRIERQLETMAVFAAGALESAPASRRSEVADSLAAALARGAEVRLTVMLADGRVISDSHHEQPSAMENHADRPEMRRALEGEVGTSRRRSRTLRRDLLYVAVPVFGRVDAGAGGLSGGGSGSRGGDVVAVARTALPATDLASFTDAFNRRAIGAIVAILALVAATSFVVSKRFAAPVESMRVAASRFAGGDLGYRVTPSGSEEMAGLGAALNRMAEHLAHQIADLERRHQEQTALFAGMVEGVVAVDADERIISINRAASTLFEIDPQRAEGRLLQEVIRNASMQRFVHRALESTDVVEGEITLHHRDEIFLQAHGTVLRGADGREIGAVVVLNDVTRLRRLEEVRRDFVANVSHELRTPVTSIKGFLETLRDGNLENPDHVRRFVDIAARQADRLHAIIEDLLTLSRLERDAERAEVDMVTAPVRPILEAALHTCTRTALDRRISLVLECPRELNVTCSDTLLVQAIVNLVDNAVKYSDPDGRVHVSASEESDGIRIRVRDWGCGIPREHLPRLFERFYTVDKARSRGLGGTGLGLAIVKHIAYAHGGEISVESQPGEGSEFTIRLPLPDDDASLEPGALAERPPLT
jgi:two-component system phosphate regulon sensor histidine kinase PhoR